METNNWWPITKVKYALGVLLTLNGATLVAALNGTISWREAGTTAIISTLPILAAYLKSSDTNET